MTTIFERIQEINQKIKAALTRSPFGPRDVVVMGASKAQSLSLIRQAADLGILDMGENYAQELLTKAPLCLDIKIRWHYIGRLQSNKIKHLIPYVSSICSVDSLELADRIGRGVALQEVSRPPMPIMIQVNQGSERQKSGLSPAIVDSLFSRFCHTEGVQVVGLMSIPPATKDLERTRRHFKELKGLFDQLKQKHPKPEIFKHISMGMSQDYEMAVEEGSNLVRLGTCLFGPRPSVDKGEDEET